MMNKCFLSVIVVACSCLAIPYNLFKIIEEQQVFLHVAFLVMIVPGFVVSLKRIVDISK